jgi:hypothetical protein
LTAVIWTDFVQGSILQNSISAENFWDKISSNFGQLKNTDVNNLSEYYGQ